MGPGPSRSFGASLRMFGCNIGVQMFGCRCLGAASWCRFGCSTLTQLCSPRGSGVPVPAVGWDIGVSQGCHGGVTGRIWRCWGHQLSLPLFPSVNGAQRARPASAPRVELGVPSAPSPPGRPCACPQSPRASVSPPLPPFPSPTASLRAGDRTRQKPISAGINEQNAGGPKEPRGTGEGRRLHPAGCSNQRGGTPPQTKKPNQNNSGRASGGRGGDARAGKAAAPALEELW